MPERKVTVGCQSCGKLNRVDLARDRPRCGACARPILLDRPMRVGEAGFDRVVSDASVPVVVDFYADWCGPCRTMAPVLDQLARERAGEVLVVKVDTDRSPQLSARFGIRSIPTLVVFREGREVGRELGAIPAPRLNALVDGALPAS